MYSQKSQKSKGRKPIFGRKQQPQDKPLERTSQTSASFLQESVVPSQPHSLQVTPHVVHAQPCNSALLRPQSVAKISVPLQTRVYSPQRVIPQPRVVLQRPLTPIPLQLKPNITFDRPTHVRQANTSIQIYHSEPKFYQSEPKFYQSEPQFYQSEPQFYQSEPQFYQNFSKIATQHFPNTESQESSVHEKVIRSDALKPTVVAVQRVMRSIDQNSARRETSALKQNFQNPPFTLNLVQPEKMKTYQKVNRRESSEYSKMKQLQEINRLLSQKYDMLYEEVEWLKEASCGGEVGWEESSFMRKAADHLHQLLRVEMQGALNEMEWVHKIGCAPKRRKELHHSYFP